MAGLFGEALEVPSEGGVGEREGECDGVVAFRFAGAASALGAARLGDVLSVFLEQDGDLLEADVIGGQLGFSEVALDGAVVRGRHFNAGDVQRDAQRVAVVGVAKSGVVDFLGDLGVVVFGHVRRGCWASGRGCNA